MDTDFARDGKVVMKGNYLLSSLQEEVWQERSIKYGYTAETIAEFIEALRKPRGVIQDVHFAAMQREQEARQNVPTELQLIISLPNWS